MDINTIDFEDLIEYMRNNSDKLHTNLFIGMNEYISDYFNNALTKDEIVKIRTILIKLDNDLMKKLYIKQIEINNKF